MINFIILIDISYTCTLATPTHAIYFHFTRVHAGGSGVGTAATQLARESGCRVFVTAGTEEKIEICKTLGAVGGANYKTEEWDEK